MSNVPEKVQYSVRPVTRFIVTRYEESPNGSARSVGKGEYDNAEIAYEVGYALAKAEHEALGWPIEDSRMVYPATQITEQP